MLAMIDLYLLLSTHPSIHVYIIYLSIIHPFIHTHIYPSIHLYLSMHLSFIYIMYALSMYLSSSHPSVHVSIIYQLSLNSFIYLSKLSIYPSIYLSIYLSIHLSDFPGGWDGKVSAYNAGDIGSVPGLGRSPGGGNGNPLQYSCIDTSVDRGAWWATACEVRVWDSWSTEQATHTRLLLHAEGPSCMGWNGDSPTQARISQLEGLDKAHCWALACLVLI